MSDTITIRIPKKLKSYLKSISRKEKVPVSDIVRESLTQYLAVREFRRLRKKTLPLAEAQGLLTDEDVFKVLS